jgi:hypothetical protein
MPSVSATIGFVTLVLGNGHQSHHKAVKRPGDRQCLACRTWCSAQHTDMYAPALRPTSVSRAFGCWTTRLTPANLFTCANMDAQGGLNLLSVVRSRPCLAPVPAACVPPGTSLRSGATSSSSTTCPAATSIMS